MIDLERMKGEAEDTAREYPETAEAEWAGDVLALVAEVERLGADYRDLERAWKESRAEVERLRKANRILMDDIEGLVRTKKMALDDLADAQARLGGRG